MTPEQKQQLEQVREQQAAHSALFDAHDSHKIVQRSEIRTMLNSIDFLLSLVKSQEAGDIPEHVDMEIVERLETPARIVKRWLLEARNGRALESVLLERDRELLERYIAQIVTTMRSAYVEKVRAMKVDYRDRAKVADSEQDNIAQLILLHKATAANEIITELESLSIEKPKE